MQKAYYIKYISPGFLVYACTLLCFWFIFSYLYFNIFIPHEPFIVSQIKSLLATVWNRDNNSDINKFYSLNVSIHKTSLVSFVYILLIILSHFPNSPTLPLDKYQESQSCYCRVPSWELTEVLPKLESNRAETSDRTTVFPKLPGETEG